MLPVSQYEELLAEVRGLRRKAQRVQQLATPLISSLPGTSYNTVCEQQIISNELNNVNSHLMNYTMESVTVEMQQNCTTSYYAGIANSSVEGDTTCSEDEGGSRSTHMSVNSEPISHESRGIGVSSLYHGTWPVEKSMWNSEPTNFRSSSVNSDQPTGMASVMSFASSSGGMPLDRVLGSCDKSSQQLEAKVDMVYSLLSMLGSQEHADMGETLLALSSSPESCLAMRQSGCIPLLVQLVQSDRDTETRKKASQALQNLINCQNDDKLKKREIRVFKLLEHARLYIEALRTGTDFQVEVSSEDNDPHPVQTIAHLMKLSFDEGHRQAICQLGGIHVIANLIEVEHSVHGSTTDEAHCVLMRRYACMALTNLTFGDSGNKALLCSLREFMRALVVQLQSPSDELRQVTASVLRNLSWRADTVSKEILREVGTVTGLMKAAMMNNKENTLKSILSALWNLSAHCTENKSEICAVENALVFLVSMLTYKTPSKSLAIIENSGGILRNISSQIAVRDDYREILRKHNCLQILLDQLKSPSLTIVSNACGTLWNLSAKCAIDQELLWQMGAPAMLRSLNHSKHKMIAMGSSAALKNLLSSRPTHTLLPQMDSTARAMDLPALPTLRARKQKSLMQELDQTLAETFENFEKDSPTKSLEVDNQMFEKADRFIASNDLLLKSFKSKKVTRSESEECVSHKERLYESRTCRSDTSLRSSVCNSEHVNYKFKAETPTLFQKNKLSKIPQYGGSVKYSSVTVTKEDVQENKYKPNKVAKEFSSSYKSKDMEKTTEKQKCNIDNKINNETDTYEPIDYSLKYEEEDLRVDITKPSLNETFTKNDHVKEELKSAQKDDEKDRCSVEDVSDLENNSKIFYASDMSVNCKAINNCDTIKLMDLEDKDIKFEENVNRAEETPLMFSRSSSLTSLGSMDHLVNDDRNSNVSDISRLTSGVVSPSELPDSPVYVMPPSPKPRTKDSGTSGSRPQPAPRSIQKPSVFEDSVTRFKVEGTPVHFSAATSLSNLSMDDRKGHCDVQNVVQTSHYQINYKSKEYGTEKVDVEKENHGDYYLYGAMSEDEGDEDMLEACISIGMQNNRHSINKQVRMSNKTCNNGNKYSTESSGIPLPKSGKSSSLLPKPVNADSAKISSGNLKSNSSFITSTPDSTFVGKEISSSNEDSRFISSLDPGKFMNVKKPIGIATKQIHTKNILNDKEANKANASQLVDSCVNDKNIDNFNDAIKTKDTTFTQSSDFEEIKNESDKSVEALSESDNCINLDIETRSVSEIVDNRMLDPDAMIESLDRFTAELVSQASSHLQNKDEAKYTASTTDGNTWNDDTSQNDISFPSISGSAPNVITFKSESNENDTGDKIINKDEEKSNDFSSLNTTSTLTESTLIAMEATKMATVFKNEADMSASIASVSSLELENVQPPSQLNHLASSGENQVPKKNFKLTSRKKSLPSGLMFRRALSNSFNQGSSLESLENRSLSNLDQMNPPSLMAELLDVADMEGSMNSVASLSSEVADNNTCSKNVDRPIQPNPIFAVKQQYCASANSITDLENINPPSLFNEITDMCNSLADVNTEAIGSETEIFEDCYTHVIDTTLKTENDDTTEFSDANSITPIQTDQSSSSESTPKKTKSLKKHLTPKQRRNLAKERYKTYTIAAEMVMREEEQKLRSAEVTSNADHMSSSTTEDYETCNNRTFTKNESSPIENITENRPLKLTAKERRQNDRSRFETQIIDNETAKSASNGRECEVSSTVNDDGANSVTNSPSDRSKSNLRRNFLQKRVENKDRFKTQTLKEPSLSLEINGSPTHNPENTLDLHYLLEKEANLVLKTLKETKSADELLDSETLSLVSNEDDSENNSGSSMHYRTYHKNWGVREKNIPVIQSTLLSDGKSSDPKNCTTSNLINDQPEIVSDNHTDVKCIPKPKITKPTENSDTVNCDVEVQAKGIRGRRKPLYSKTNLMKTPSKTIKPIKNMTSNLVNNVTSSFRTTTGVKVNAEKSKLASPNRTLKPPSGNNKFTKTTVPAPKTNALKATTNKNVINKNNSKLPQQLERQGTFVKEDKDNSSNKSKIPTSASSGKSTSLSRIAKPVVPSVIPKTISLASKNANGKNGFVKSASSDRGSKVSSSPIRFYRSPSADSKENISTNRKIQSSLSSQSLKSDSGRNQGATAKRSSIPNSSTRSDSNSSLNSTTSNPKKQITSKIASLWAKIEENKKQAPKKDNKIWITSNSQSSGVQSKLTLVRSNTFGNESSTAPKKEQNKTGSPKHISRIGSISMQRK